MARSSKYTPAMTGGTVWDLPMVERLREGSISERRYRERTAAFQALAKDVESRWYDLPYDVRVRLAEYAESFDLDYRPRNFREWLGLLILPFSFLKTYATGEHYVSMYVVAMAQFIAAVHLRMRDEREGAARAWDLVTRDDPGFARPDIKEVAATLERRDFVRVRCTDLKTNTR